MVSTVASDEEIRAFLGLHDRPRPRPVHPPVLAAARPHAGNRGQRVPQRDRETLPPRQPVFRARHAAARLDDRHGADLHDPGRTQQHGILRQRARGLPRPGVVLLRRRRSSVCRSTSTSPFTSRMEPANGCSWTRRRRAPRRCWSTATATLPRTPARSTSCCRTRRRPWPAPPFPWSPASASTATAPPCATPRSWPTSTVRPCAPSIPTMPRISTSTRPTSASIRRPAISRTPMPWPS